MAAALTAYDPRVDDSETIALIEIGAAGCGVGVRTPDRSVEDIEIYVQVDAPDALAKRVERDLKRIFDDETRPENSALAGTAGACRSMPRSERSERRPSELLLTDLVAISDLAGGLAVASSTLRTATLERARSFISVACDEAVAERLADLLATARSTGRRAGAMDAIIAATAVVHDLTVWTQDDDFELLCQLLPALRVRRG